MPRIERDSLGEREVPEEVYWGLQTLRTLETFPISGLREHPRYVESFVMLKKACAIANKELGMLDASIADAIAQAADEVLAGKLREQFCVDVYHMGAGTSFNMNVNEVLANRANEILGGQKGDYALCNPNDHVNFGQSTNDTTPTALRLAVRLHMNELIASLEGLEEAFHAKGREFDGIIKSGRTHLQDAVPVRLGQEFAAYAETVKKCRNLLAQAACSVEELGIGGSAAGTGLNTHPQYRFRVVDLLSEWTGVAFRPATDMREAMQSSLPVATVSSVLRNIALEIGRICNDLRLLCSGPLTGLAEITLPAVQPGSSIMPGKINPSVPEMVNMVCFQVVGNDLTIALAVQAGQLELNVMMPVMAHNALTGIEILKNALRQLTDRCVAGIVADEERCRRYAFLTPSAATVLNTYVGYQQAAAVVKQALAEGKTVVEVVRERNLLTEEQIAQVFDPVVMTEPGIPGKTG
ncbi:MAG: aspartate ammonia-lyase [Armatimonadetes bacterium]|nr:aspartate ammonia-lyase [Armatimonadota bacterium]